MYARALGSQHEPAREIFLDGYYGTVVVHCAVDDGESPAAYGAVDSVVM